MDISKPIRTSLRVPYLDLARFLAAIYVALYHLSFRLDWLGFMLSATHAQYGYLGVKFFFILSGFVIFQSATREGAKEFGIKRFIRLYPMLLICATTTFVISLFVQVPDPASILGYISNISMASFVSPDGAFVDQSYWTLREEILFYTIIGFLIVFKKIDKSDKWIPVLFVISMLSHLFEEIVRRKAPGHLEIVSETASYIPVHLPLFLIGCIFFIRYRDGKIRPILWATLIASIVWSLLETHREAIAKLADIGGSPNFAVALVALSVAFFFYIAVGDHSKMRQPSKLEEHLGRASYPLYLIHQEVGLVLLAALAPLTGRWPALFIVLILLSVLAYSLSTFLEVPLQRMLRVKLLPRKNVTAA